MNTVDFASAYPRTFPEERYAGTPYAEVLAPSREWSNLLGELLHDRLAAPTTINEPAARTLVSDYTKWYQKDFGAIHNALPHEENRQVLKQDNELNFHQLSACMVLGWLGIASPNKQLASELRKAALRTMQEMLAIVAFQNFEMRAKRAGVEGHFEYHSEAAEPLRRTVEGILTEFDGAIVLAEIAKRHPRMTVVPAPAQFEHYKRSTNIDFVTLNGTQAMGAQVKSFVREQYSDHDSARVIFIDGRLDMGNQLAMRVDPKSSDLRRVNWGGIISAQVLSKIVTHGKGTSLLLREGLVDQNKLMRYRQLAQILLNSPTPIDKPSSRKGHTQTVIKSWLFPAAQVVEERLMDKGVLTDTKVKST